MIIHQTLSVLEDIVENVSGESTKSRQICYHSLQESVQVSLALFPAFIHQSGRGWLQAGLSGGVEGAGEGQRDCLALRSPLRHRAGPALTLTAEGSEGSVGPGPGPPGAFVRASHLCSYFHF